MLVLSGNVCPFPIVRCTLSASSRKAFSPSGAGEGSTRTTPLLASVMWLTHRTEETVLSGFVAILAQALLLFGKLSGCKYTWYKLTAVVAHHRCAQAAEGFRILSGISGTNIPEAWQRSFCYLVASGVSLMGYRCLVAGCS